MSRQFFSKRFPELDLSEKSLQEMMGLEGQRVRKLYLEKAEQYQVGWRGRQYQPGKFELSDITNQILTATNAALYGILCSVVHSLGYSPHIGFIHSGSPLPFVYDLADLYKESLCIDLAFAVTRDLAGRYDKYIVAEHFRQRVLQMDLLSLIVADIESLLGTKKVSSKNDP